MQFSETSRRVVKSEIREILRLTRQPDVISFAGGLPDARLFPTKQIAQITARVLEQKGYLALQYGPTDGEKDFKEAIRSFAKDSGEIVELDQICVTSSSQQGLDLLSLLFIDNGSPIVLELPSYLGAIQAYRRCGAEMHGVRMDDGGMVLKDLEAVLERLEAHGRRPRFINVIPDFQNPSGITMTLERRKKLIEVAASWRIPIVEDSPYRDIVFEGEKLPSLWMLSGGKGVITLKTLSKMLFPGMRLGWMYGPAELIDQVIAMKQSVDLCSPSFTQLIIAEYMSSGLMAQSLSQAIDLYRPKAKAMLAALEREMPAGVRWSIPTGGMFLWVVLPEHIDTREMFAEAVEKRVAYIMGQPFHCDGSGSNTLRLNFSFPSLEQIDEGIQRLAAVVRTRL